MFKKPAKNPLVRIFTLLFAVTVLGVAVAQWMAKDAVSGFLVRKLPPHVQLEYEMIEVNVLTGTVALKDIVLDFYDRDSMLLNTRVKMNALSLEGLGYWDYLFRKKIKVQRLLLDAPAVRYYPYRILPKGDDEPAGVVHLLKSIEVKKLSVQNGRLDLLQQGEDSISVRVRDVNFYVTDARTGPELITQKIPVDYGGYELNTDSVYVNLSPYEELEVSGVFWNRDHAKVTGLQLHSKYGKNELSRHLATERDYIDLSIPEMHLDSIRFGFERDTFYIATGAGTIRKPDLEIYRDKLVADDSTPKKLYSRSLRQLPIHIDVPKIEIVDGNVVYSERVAEVADPGKLIFENLNASLSNISNTYAPGGKTTVKAQTEFMGYADMTLSWSFDINSGDDAFWAAGTVSDFDTKSVNPFLQSNLRAEVSGAIDQMYFTVSGDAVSSTGDMKMKYKDLRFKVFKKDGTGINRFLTAVGNLFVNAGSTNDADGFRYGRIDAERDPTKSFFNYLWLNVRDGTLSTLTGNGKKEE
ncbi:MAG TPA: hypothetical protein VFM69_06240 [Pricia sp.]|nr:hypothetical protein [Pricia sp.]